MTTTSPEMVTVQPATSTKHPLHPWNREPEKGSACNTTVVPVGN
jgi:hypothetical protein